MIVSSDLARHAGKTIGIYGSLSQLPHQHLVDTEAVRGREVGYFQLDDRWQIVVYLPRDFVACQGPMRLQGEVLRVQGGPKRPGQEQKRDNDPGYVEHQLIVAGGECLQPETPASWLRDLGRETVPLARKQELIDRLAAKEKAVIPLLIAQLGDERIYTTRQQVPAAALNAPPTAPAPQPVTVTIPVGQICTDLLYDLIMPEYVSPHAGRAKPFSASILVVRDWAKWWQANSHRSLAEIRKSLEPRIDRYWLEHGTVQVLDEE